MKLDVKLSKNTEYQAKYCDKKCNSQLACYIPMRTWTNSHFCPTNFRWSKWRCVNSSISKRSWAASAFTVAADLRGLISPPGEKTLGEYVGTPIN